jgi:hypothetical protein
MNVLLIYKENDLLKTVSGLFMIKTSKEYHSLVKMPGGFLLQYGFEVLEGVY